MKRRLSQARISDLLFENQNKASEKGKRGAAVQNAKARVYVYIEGKPYTYQELADRLGISANAVMWRVKQARKSGGPMTLEKLERAS